MIEFTIRLPQHPEWPKAAGDLMAYVHAAGGDLFMAGSGVHDTQAQLVQQFASAAGNAADPGAEFDPDAPRGKTSGEVPASTTPRRGRSG